MYDAPWKSAIWRDPVTVLGFRVFGRYNNLWVGELKKTIILGLNGVAVARHGPILGENGAVGSRRVFRYLPDLREAIKKSKMADKVKKYKNTVFYRIFYI